MVLAAVLAMLGSGYMAGQGTVTREDLLHAKERLTPDELIYGADIANRSKEACGGKPGCDVETAYNVLNSLNYRRHIYWQVGNSILRSEIFFKCSNVDVYYEVACLKTFDGYTYEEIMGLIGYKYLGVTLRGYYKIRIGMSLDDVEFILGPGEESSYVSGYGSTLSIYSWSKGYANIVVSFKDGQVTGRSQVGL